MQGISKLSSSPANVAFASALPRFLLFKIGHKSHDCADQAVDRETDAGAAIDSKTGWKWAIIFHVRIFPISLMNTPGTPPTYSPIRIMQPVDIHPNAEPLLAICLFAAFADGDKTDDERAQIDSLARELGSGDISGVSRRILMGRLSLDAAADQLKTSEERMLAYEIARAVCEANGSISADEQAFLSDLRAKLALGADEAEALDGEVDSVVLAPLDAGEPVNATADQGGMILRYSILNGALELLPATFATMAILPLQMKMVWRIGKAHGFELDRSSITEFLATAGVGIGSQVVEGFARKLIGGFGRKFGGKLVGRVANEATGSAFSFASTYAIGHLAVNYYAGGRQLGRGDLKSLYGPLTHQARELHAKYLPEIQQRASSLDAGGILNLVRGKATV